MTIAIGGEPGGQRVLAGTAAENQNSHDVKGLARVAATDAAAEVQDYFVDVDAEVRLESAVTVIA
jgi:hypothetical protein